MSDIDVTVREQLDRLVPAYGAPDWEAVLARAGRTARRPHRRWLVIVAAATAVAVIVGVAPAAALGGFSSWLSGQPGKPVSPAEQRAFERANTHSYLGFPPGTKLRQLTTERLPVGVRVDLLGFRAQSTLCLRVIVTGKTRDGRQSCAPLADLRRAGPPVRVVLVDQSFGKGTKTEWYGVDRVHSAALQVTAGIVADGVSSVTVQDESGRHTLAVKATLSCMSPAIPMSGSASAGFGRGRAHGSRRSSSRPRRSACPVRSRDSCRRARRPASSVPSTAARSRGRPARAARPTAHRPAWQDRCVSQTARGFRPRGRPRSRPAAPRSGDPFDQPSRDEGHRRLHVANNALRGWGRLRATADLFSAARLRSAPSSRVARTSSSPLPASPATTWRGSSAT